MTTTTMTSVNGINVEAVAQATDAMKKTPRLAAIQFRSVTDWKDGAVSVTTFAGYAKGETSVTRSKPHTLAADEPPATLMRRDSPTSTIACRPASRAHWDGSPSGQEARLETSWRRFSDSPQHIRR